MKTKTDPWSLQDQLDLIGKRGRLRQAAARRRYAARSARATRAAERSTERYARFLAGELDAADYYSDGAGPSAEVRQAFARIVE